MVYIGMSIKVKDRVQRGIEGEWFDAIVEEIDRSRQVCTVRYLDDDNIETDVPLDEVRKATNEENNQRSVNTSRKETLPRPLAGLVDDDHEFRKKHMPTVFVHDDNSNDEAIIMNGAENKLAAGGGLRALRYLKS